MLAKIATALSKGLSVWAGHVIEGYRGKDDESPLYKTISPLNPARESHSNLNLQQR